MDCDEEALLLEAAAQVEAHKPPVPLSGENRSGNGNANRNGHGKKKNREELSDGGTSYKKDREEWSDCAINSLLDVYTDKYATLNRRNLRVRDWEEVATVVSERCDGQKSVKNIEQCKNKVDNLKKRYKAERQRLSSGGTSSVSHWPWYNKMDQIVGSGSKAVSDEDIEKSTAGLNFDRLSKRLATTTPSSIDLVTNSKPKTLPTPRWRRVLLKVSGKALIGGGPHNVNPKVIMLIAKEVAIVNRLGVEVAIVVGGGNFFCGSSWAGYTGLDKASADQIGMMATVMNAIILQASMEHIGIQTRVQTAFQMVEVAEPYSRVRAIHHLEKGRVVIFGAGTGNPFFTTDTAAALRAAEINATVVLKGTNVDGVYDCDPKKNSHAVVLDHISYRDFAAKGLSEMDITGVTLCQENCIPVVLFNLYGPGNISRALTGDQVGTLID